MKNGWGKFIGGFVLGSAGLSFLGSKLAQKGYRYVAAGAFIARDNIMERAEKIQGAASDIAADAHEITERYYQSCDQAFDEEMGTEEETEAAEE